MASTRLAAGLVVIALALGACSAPAAVSTASSRSGNATSAAQPTSAPSTTTGRADGDAHRAVHVAAPAGATQSALASRCAGTHASQSVVVSLAVQHMWLCHRGQTVRTYPITSGRGTGNDRTPTGTFRIQGRNRNTVLTLSSGRQYDVKYWIPFDAPNFGFHDASWQKFPYGSSRYRTDGSHGCVHMPLKAIAFFYRWVQIGAKVRITAT